MRHYLDLFDTRVLQLDVVIGLSRFLELESPIKQNNVDSYLVNQISLKYMTTITVNAHNKYATKSDVGTLNEPTRVRDGSRTVFSSVATKNEKTPRPTIAIAQKAVRYKPGSMVMEAHPSVELGSSQDSAFPPIQVNTV